MRRSLLFVAVCLWAGMLSAQELLPNGAIKFVLETTADAVELNFGGQRQRMQAQTVNGKKQFVWQSAPLESGLYTYTFVVDGVEIVDPQNVHTMRDCGRQMSYVIVNREDNKAENLLQRAVPHGTVEYTYYDAQGVQRRMAVYLPPSYYTSQKLYPVLYLLHGTFGDEAAWLELGRAAQILDNMIASGAAQEMIVIFPNENLWQTEEPRVATVWGEEADRLTGYKTFETTYKMADGRFEEQFGELLNQMEHRYRIICKKQSRAIAGLSRGGYFAFHISHYYNQLFDYVGLFSATYETKSPSRIYRNIDKDLQKQFLTPPRVYWIGIGKDDFLYEANVDFRKQLDAAGYHYTYHESAGGHEWKNWRDYLQLFLPLLFKD